MPNSDQVGHMVSGAALPRGIRRALPAVIFAVTALVLAGRSGWAEDQAKPAPPAGVAVVDGLAPGDMLNVRATPSAIGEVQARLPNGTGVQNLGCTQYSGYDWCKITTLEAPKVTGWTPARYLLAAGDNPPASKDAAQAPAAGSGKGAKPDLPDNLDARIGQDGGGQANTAGEPDDQKLRDAIIARYRPIYRSALGLSGKSATPAPIAPNPTPNATPNAAPNAGSDQPAPAANAAPSADGTPVPTPRPDAAGKGAGGKEGAATAVASVEAAQKAAGQVPCATIFGQPMQECQATVTRLGPGVADVVVNLPDGGSRTIRFRGGKADGTDSSEPLDVTREGTLNMIRIGKGERYEILDALALGK